MQRSYLKHSIVFFFLAIFLMMKMAGLHVLAHSGDEDHYAHCIVSDYVVKSQHTPQISSTGFDFAVLILEPVPQEQNSKEYEFLSDGVLAIGQLFSRPPPF
ncbi:hypothetical protein [Allomuricauda sp. F6463D]|uniref:hypothetical protein n=1 Tax=Allomuricauda sp. F6463D TaxID=2926409 RepID=UPI001FF121A5|nr:hypothetical protein [Muricauda sp. F6463D]MCK0160006.1 hypothetical protein [Muricauda sp. F6463D]